MVSGARARRLAVLVALVATPISGVTSAHAAVTEAGGVTTLPTPSAKERRAVRGRALVEITESEDQATVRRFEASLPELASMPLPPVAPQVRATKVAGALEGHWAGSGDEPLPPQGVAQDTPAAAAGPLADLYVDFFSKDPEGSAVLARAVERLTPWWSSCEAALVAAGTPAELAVAALALTGFESGSRGADGEAGPWRLSVEQARRAGLRVTVWIDERRDPVRASEAAGRTLAGLQQRFGSWPLALAAFHSGPALLERALEQVPAGDFAQLVSGGGPLPRPTRLFLAKVGAMSLLGFPQGRFVAAGRPADALATIDVPGALTLGSVARAARIDLATLRALNPALIGDRVAPFAAPVALRVPAPARKPSRAALESARGPDDDVKVVSLRLGESPRLLAASSGVAERELCRLNSVASLSDLRGATEVLLPAHAAAPAFHNFSAAGADDRGAGYDPPLVAVPARTFEAPGKRRVFYFVLEGDTLEEIARATEVAVTDIVAWNNVDPRARLQPKMILQLFVAPTLDRSRVALLDATQVRAVALGSDEFHTLEVALRGKSRLVHAARVGETLPKIARRYGLTAPDLARINRMSWNSELFDGQRIVVYAPSAANTRETAVGRSQHPKRRVSGR